MRIPEPALHAIVRTEGAERRSAAAAHRQRRLARPSRWLAALQRRPRLVAGLAHLWSSRHDDSTSVAPGDGDEATIDLTEGAPVPSSRRQTDDHPAARPPAGEGRRHPASTTVGD